MKTGIQKIRILSRNHHLLLIFCRKKRKKLGSHQINQNMVLSKRYVNLQYLVGNPFALITASMRRGIEAISLWHCLGVMEAQISLMLAVSSSLFLGLVPLIFLLIIPHRFSMRFRSSELAGQSSTVMAWASNQVWNPTVVVHLPDASECGVLYCSFVLQ